mgnify:CR=1 FL=1
MDSISLIGITLGVAAILVASFMTYRIVTAPFVHSFHNADTVAMHVAMPEVDGRIITRAISFKGLSHRSALTQSDVVQYQAHAERLAFVVELAQRWCRLRGKLLFW